MYKSRAMGHSSLEIVCIVSTLFVLFVCSASGNIGVNGNAKNPCESTTKIAEGYYEYQSCFGKGKPCAGIEPHHGQQAICSQANFSDSNRPAYCWCELINKK